MHPPSDPAVSLRDLLSFYAEAGVDEALDEVAPNRFDEKPPPAARQSKRATQDAAADQSGGAIEGPTASSPRDLPPASWGASAATIAPRAPPSTASVPDEGQVKLARELAARSRNLEELKANMAAFDGCNLKFTAKNLVFADGTPGADLMLVGEAPGRDEDLEGLPFVGRSGQLLDRILAAIGRDRSSAYIANVVPWRPPGNRAPTPLETEICRPFIERQIELAGPKLLVTLGGPSAKVLLKTTEGVLRLRGNWREHVPASGQAIPAMPTLHPAYLLRTPAHKKLAWRDFLEVKVKLRALQG